MAASSHADIEFCESERLRSGSFTRFSIAYISINEINQLYRIPLKKLIREKNLESPSDVVGYLDDNHPDLENDRRERLSAVGAAVMQEGSYSRRPWVGLGSGNKKWKADDFDKPMYTNPGTVKKSDYRYVYGPQKVYRGRTLRIKNKLGVFYIRIHFQKP